MLPTPQTVPVIGTDLAAVDYAAAVALARERAALGQQPFLIAAANTHLVTLARHEPSFARSMTAFDLILPDGMPLVWAMNKRLASRLEDRVYGPTFMLRCLEATQGTGWSHAFVGGSEALLKKLRQQLLGLFPDLNISTMYSPPFGEWSSGEDRKITEQITDSGANFVWIGLGCPKQERWLASQKGNLPPAVYSAVGAAFAFHAGLTPQAPAWMQRTGLEWLFRLIAEPRRLIGRYVKFNSLFLFYMVAEGWRLRRFNKRS
jgi:N-acetylglucosaminyldiphosphoundecaprenol N-acetyl-beta-D-mannosaminyltransferase